ncbi:MAG: VWA domain-containing protein [Pseudomonadota bacterium]
MARRKKRDVEGFSLSFLDCICCGFGAIILLLVLTKIYEPVTIEKTQEDLRLLIARLQQELFELRGDTVIIDRELESARDQVDESKERLARLQGELTRIRGQFNPTEDESAFSEEVEGELEVARQSLTEEMRRLRPNFRRPSDAPVGGIPVDSEYVIFIIDTSGSMQQYSWPLVLRKITETLDLYPEVKGMQVMNDNGRYMFETFAGKWIPDTPTRRRAVLQTLANWRPLSFSTPVNGIKTAIATFAAPDKKISLYVFGDEYTGQSVESVADAVDRMNTVDAEGNRLVRIHAVGFPLRFGSGQIQQSTVQFAALMRELTFRNGGTFVALTDRR